MCYALTLSSREHGTLHICQYTVELDGLPTREYKRYSAIVVQSKFIKSDYENFYRSIRLIL